MAHAMNRRQADKQRATAELTDDVPEIPYLRCPTGLVDQELRIRVLQEVPAGLPLLDIRTFRRSPADVSDSAFRATVHGTTLQLQFAEHLIEQIERAVAAADRRRE